MADKMKTPDDLRAEIARIDLDLQKLADRERAAETAADGLALAAYRGDKKAEAKISKHDGERAEIANWRRHLQAARTSIEAELSRALALERSEETKAKAREAAEIAAIFAYHQVDRR